MENVIQGCIIMLEEDALKIKIENLREKNISHNFTIKSINEIKTLISFRQSEEDIFIKEIKILIEEGKLNVDEKISPIKKYSSESTCRTIKDVISGKNISDTDISSCISSLDYELELMEQKIKENIISISEMELEVIRLENENPLEQVKFGDSYGIRDLYTVDPALLSKKIVNVIVQDLSERKKSSMLTRKGNIHWKKTIDKSMKYDGTPYELQYTSKGISTTGTKPKIYILVDISGSVSPFIPFSINIAQALSIAFNDYETIIYSSPCMNAFDDENIYNADEHSKRTKKVLSLVAQAERKDTQGNIWDSMNRFSKKSFKKYKNNPEELKNKLRYGIRSDSDFIHSLLISLIDVASTNSLFLIFSDDSPYVAGNYARRVSKKSGFCNKLKSFENNIFWFNVSEQTDQRAIDGYSILSYKDNQRHGAEGIWNRSGTVPLCKKFKTPEKNFYPKYGEAPENYGKWMKTIISLLKKNLI